jgi:predicted kinase
VRHADCPRWLTRHRQTTIAKILAARLSATYLRIDEIEHALRSAAGFERDIGPAGYAVTNALAASNLAIGRHVVADCVNPVRESREGWRDVASRAGVALIEVEVICSDATEHRRRIEDRLADIAGFELPIWQSVLQHEYEAWPEPHLVIDTATLKSDEAVAVIERHIERTSRGRRF